MTDRELIELAAKAAAVNLQWIAPTYKGVYIPGVDGLPWNPLTDDGDALRLAMQLDIDVQFNTDDDEQTTSAIAPSPEQPGSGEGWNFTEGWRGDKYAATRRAIVRAAAEIGRNIP
jgi:hypothetical protein